MKLIKLTFVVLFSTILSFSSMAVDVDSDTMGETAEVAELTNTSEKEMTRMGILLGSCLFATFVIITARQSKNELIKED